MSRFNALEVARLFVSGRMIVATLMGFVCGLPLLLTGSVLQAWMAQEGMDLGTIGLFALVGLPYTLKFIWAPFFDHYKLLGLGRRRGWLLLVQLALMVALVLLAVSHPGNLLWVTAVAALLTSFFSASQDIVVDAYRRESLADEELGLGSSLYVGGYRTGTLVAGGLGLILADHIGFEQTYLFMALVMSVGVVTTLLAPEPKLEKALPKTLREAVIDPFLEYFSRPFALRILLFILLYKVGDTMATNMTIPFYLDMGYSKTEIGAVAKLFGFWAILAGGIVGGVLLLRIGIYRGLWLFGIGQGLSTAGFALLSQIEPDITALASVIALENFTAGMGTAAFVAYMASLTDKRFTATQYALLTSLMGIPRVLIAAPTGFMAAAMGWFWFFAMCALLAIPGLILLRRLHGRSGASPITHIRHAD